MSTERFDELPEYTSLDFDPLNESPHEASELYKDEVSLPYTEGSTFRAYRGRTPNMHIPLVIELLRKNFPPKPES